MVVQRAARYFNIDLKKLVDEAMHYKLSVELGDKSWALVLMGLNVCAMSTEYISRRPVHVALWRNPPSGVEDGFWTVDNAYLDTGAGLEPTSKTLFKSGNKVTSNLNAEIDGTYRKFVPELYASDGCIGHWSMTVPLLNENPDEIRSYNFRPDIRYCGVDEHHIFYWIPEPGRLVAPAGLLAAKKADI